MNSPPTPHCPHIFETITISPVLVVMAIMFGLQTARHASGNTQAIIVTHAWTIRPYLINALFW